MTPLLQQAFDAVATMSAADQDAIAARLLDELSAEDAFDRAIHETSEKLGGLAAEALAEYRAGETKLLDTESL